jgi:glycosyltransferase involved in cell wall biosynthesis
VKILIATAMYPTSANPAFGSFVRAQIESLQHIGVDVELLVLQGRIRKLIYPKGILQLRQRLSDDSIDLVHAHYSYVGIVARAQWKVPVVVTYHGDDLLGTVSATGRKTRFSRLSVALGRLLAESVDAVIVQSAEMARALRRRDVCVIPHEVQLDRFRPISREHARAALGLDPARKYLLFAADPSLAVKRFPLAREAAAVLWREDSSVELLVVYREPQDRLTLYMNACDALVFPSFQEGSPNIVKQAMACNLPIVATDVGDIREILGATVGCHICRPDAVEFAEKLRGILHSRQRTNGRERVRHLAGPIVARQLLQVYEQTLAARRTGRRPSVRPIA